MSAVKMKTLLQWIINPDKTKCGETRLRHKHIVKTLVTHAGNDSLQGVQHSVTNTAVNRVFCSLHKTAIKWNNSSQQTAYRLQTIWKDTSAAAEDQSIGAILKTGFCQCSTFSVHPQLTGWHWQHMQVKRCPAEQLSKCSRKQAPQWQIS